MFTIPDDVQEMIRKEGIILVGSVDKNCVCNISPRSAIFCLDNTIYWLDYFSHKSRQNFQQIPWVSVAVFNKSKVRGFQLKGKVSFVTDEKEKIRITDLIIRTCSSTFCKMYEELSINNQVQLVKFEPKAIYSLNPQEEAGRALVLENDRETVSLLGIW